MNNDLERLRRLKKLNKIKPDVKLTLYWPPGGGRVRCLANGNEIDPTGMFDNQGRTNSDKVFGKAIDRAADRYVDLEPIA